MESDYLVRFILLFIFIVFSALFSGAEVSLFSLDVKKLTADKSESSTLRKIRALLESPKRLLVTILLGNTIFNVASSILTVVIALDIAKLYGFNVDFALLIQIIVLTVVILIFGEITPKIFASKNSIVFAKIVSFPIYWLSILIYPISQSLVILIKFSTSKINYDKSKTVLGTADLKELADIGAESGTLVDDEQDLIQGLVSFKQIVSREVMTPRMDIVAIPKDTKFDEAIKLINESGHSRIPIYDENLDNIIGMLYAKDLLPYISSKSESEKVLLEKIARTPYFIPETKPISQLMHEFQERNIHIGVVVDEYGGTAGLVSLEDIIEEIVGEIRDEYDNEEIEITKLDDKSYIVLGKTDINEFNEAVEANIQNVENDYETVGGFILNYAGKIPEENYSFNHGNFKYTVKEITDKRITKIHVEKIEANE